jgi:hypothetical protein
VLIKLFLVELPVPGGLRGQGEAESGDSLPTTSLQGINFTIYNSLFLRP